MSVDPARKAAFEVLRSVREDDSYANLTMPGVLTRLSLGGRDAGFATELAYGTLRWQGFYDAILATFVSRPWAEVDADMQAVLRLGVHQLLKMRVPAHAAVDSACELARSLGAPGGASARAGFANAILRKVATHDYDYWATSFESVGGIEALATRWSHPAWIVRAFQDALGDRRAELPALLAADNEPAHPVLVARPGRINPEVLRERPEVTPGRYSPLAAVLLKGAPDALDIVRSGAVGVQDEGSQLVALALTRAAVSQPENAWLDMCAGPGGKAAILAGLAAARGITFTAMDLHPHRAHLVESALGEVHAEIIVGDATEAPWGDKLFDRILVDAPCTGLGALRRRPEARWRKSPADLSTLGPLQRALLKSAIAATRPGGVIIYATCSPHLAETEFVVADVVSGQPRVVVEDARALLPEVSDVSAGPFVQLWPHRHGTDAMFFALLRKTD
ncbi:rRNA cytosine-C5-methyltransferase [Actinomycetes bacterium]|nr:rRNA cytosine-C5-methyltransferase [Actinomycetes bacterium]